MEKLRKQLHELLEKIPQDEREHFYHGLNNITSVFPFNEQEYIIGYLLHRGVITFEQYLEIREQYISRNIYLSLFEISAPRGFGEKWAQGHLQMIAPELQKPSKKTDPNYSGQYDFYLDQKIRIEVKASRAVDFDSYDPLYQKALASDSPKKFDMNFQQVKPSCSDVFVWMGVWRDKIRYWILASHEVENNRYYSRGQHRGNVGEGQLHVTHDNIREFQKNESDPDEITMRIRKAYEKQIAYVAEKNRNAKP